VDVLGSVTAKILTTRALVRAPITLYRRGFGWLFGSRMMMLQHTGRSSGQPRYVCLEVVDRPAEDRLIIVSGFGTSSQWYRNLLADHRCRVSTGRLRDVAAVARPMSESESGEALARYAQNHPSAWRRLKAAIEKAIDGPVDALPMFELTLRPAPDPSDVDSDL
jgi:deazaflavin-dependent oxidoreductase (nitroreductase family)